MKPAKRAKHPKPRLRSIPWRMTPDTFDLYLIYGQVAMETQPGSDAYEAAIEALKKLPGYPGSAEGDMSVEFQPILIDTPSSLRVH